MNVWGKSSTPKGSRPEVSSYMNEEQIGEHLARFEEGDTRFVVESNFKKYGFGQRDGTAFVLPKSEADKILRDSQGDTELIEESLGLPKGFLSDNNLVRVDIPDPEKANIRLPSGNEAGANPQWIPGGKLPNGNSEAVIDAGDLGEDEFIKKVLEF